jgi:hypothetical protein
MYSVLRNEKTISKNKNATTASRRKVNAEPSANGGTLNIESKIWAYYTIFQQNTKVKYHFKKPQNGVILAKYINYGYISTTFQKAERYIAADRSNTGA